jgi:hypothetical protein
MHSRHSLCIWTQIAMYNYTWRILLAFIPPCCLPHVFPFVPLSIPFHLLGTLLAVTGSVHLGPRLLVN